MVVLVDKDKEEDHVWVILDDGSRVHISWLEEVEKKNEITSSKNTVVIPKCFK